MAFVTMDSSSSTPFDKWIQQWQDNDYNVPMEAQMRLARNLCAGRKVVASKKSSTEPRQWWKPWRQQRRWQHPNQDPPIAVRTDLSFGSYTEESFARWDGIRLAWLRDVFLKLPEIQTFLEYGCRMWFVRTAGVLALLERRSVYQGALIDYLDKLNVSELGESHSANASRIGKATVFVSFTGFYTLRHFAKVLIENLAEDEYLWIDTFCVDQFLWVRPSTSRTEQRLREWKDKFMHMLQKHILSINNTALVLHRFDDAMEALRRIWVVWEVYCTVNGGAHFQVLLTLAEQQNFKRQILEVGDQQTDKVFGVIAHVDIGKAKAAKSSDTERILNLVRNSHGGISEVNHKVTILIRKWMVDYCLSLYRDSSPDVYGYGAMCNNVALLVKDVGGTVENPHDLAAKIYQAGLASSKFQFGAHHSLTLTLTHNLGLLTGDANLLRQAYEGRKCLLSESHPHTLSSWYHSVRARSKSDPSRTDTLRKILQKSEKLLGANHDYVKHWKCDLAVESLNDGFRLQEAMTVLQSVRLKDVNIRRVSNCQGIILLEMGQAKAAEALFRTDCEQEAKMSGKTISYCVVKGNIAKALMEQGRHEEALDLLDEALHILFSKFGERGGIGIHYALYQTQMKGTIRHRMGQYNAARADFRDVMTKFKTISPNHEFYLRTIHNYAAFLYDTNDLAQAISLYKEVLLKRKEFSTPSSPRVLNSKFGLAQCRCRQLDFSRARRLVLEATQGLNTCYGSDHQRVGWASIVQQQLELEENTEELHVHLDLLRF